MDYTGRGFRISNVRRGLLRSPRSMSSVISRTARIGSAARQMGLPTTT